MTAAGGRAGEAAAGAERDGAGLMCALLTEVGIVERLARNRFEAAMGDGLRLPHCRVLNHLVRLGDGRSPKSLAAAFRLSKSATTNSVRRLQACGFVDVRTRRIAGASGSS